MTNFILIGLCIVAGMLIRRFSLLPPNSHKGINAWIINIALPAVSFKYLPYIQWNTELLLPVFSPIVIWIGAWLWITWYGKKNDLDKKTIAGLKLTTGLCNTSFIGFPLVSAYFSENELGIAVICDQITFMILSSAGIMVAINSTGNQSLRMGTLAKKMLKFPPFIGCVSAVVFPHFVDITFLTPLFDQLSGTVGPLALFSIGLQLKFDGWRDELKHISFALFYKLLIAPSLILGIVLVLNLKGIIAQITVFEGALASLVSSGVVADQYELNPKVSNLVIGTGIALAFITTYFWWLIITYLV